MAKHNWQQHTTSKLRIIGGKHGGRSIQYSGDKRTRPMKERVREAMFNLVGSAVKDTHVIDLFAGTGAIGLEAISRGASSLLMIERHFPTARIINDNIREIGEEDVCEIVTSDTFFWFNHRFAKGLVQLPNCPWSVFCSPPYDLFIDMESEIQALITSLMESAPKGSMFCLESDQRFEVDRVFPDFTWQTREYPPAVLHVSHQ